VSEIEQLIEAVKQLGPAIESLKQKPTPDYLWPVMMALVSSFLGATGGYLVVRLHVHGEFLIDPPRWTISEF